MGASDYAEEAQATMRELLGGQGTVDERDGVIGAEFEVAGFLGVAAACGKIEVGSGGALRELPTLSGCITTLFLRSRAEPPMKPWGIGIKMPGRRRSGAEKRAIYNDRYAVSAAQCNYVAGSKESVSDGPLYWRGPSRGGMEILP